MRITALIGAAAVGVALVALRRRVTRTVLALSLAAVAALCVYGGGLVSFPDLEHVIRSIGPHLGRWTYALVAGLAFLESGAFVGLVAPGEFAVIFGGFVAGQGLVDPFVLGALVAAAALTGDVVSFLLGRRLGRSFLEEHGRAFGIGPARLAAIEGFYARHGGKTIVLGRFVGLARAVSPFVAGASRMRLRRFLAVDVPAVLAWTATFVALGFVFWQSFDRAVTFAKRGNLALFFVVALLAAAVVAVRALRSPGARRRLVLRLRRRRRIGSSP